MEEIEDIQAPIGLLANSMVGVVGVSFIKFVRKIMGKEISFLVVLRTTHNFVDLYTSKSWAATSRNAILCG